MSSSTVSLRAYNGPYMWSDASSLHVSGNLQISQLASIQDVAVSNSLTVTQRVSAANITASSTLTTPAANITGVAVANSISFGQPFAASDTNFKLTNKIQQVILGTVYLGNGSSATIDHGLNIEPNLYVINTSFCDSDPNERQLVTVQVVGKSANTFTLSCVPANGSNTASIDFQLTQLVV